MKKLVRKAQPKQSGRSAPGTVREPHGVARRLLVAFFLMAAAPLLVFLAVDTLGLGHKVLGGLIGDDPANVILAAATAAVVAFFLGTRMARRITTPLGQLAAAAAVLSRGELPARLTIEEDDEFGRLADAFNTMADRLTGTISDLNAKLQSLSTELFYLSSLGTTLSEGSDPLGDLRRLTPRLRTMFTSDFAWLFLAGDGGVQLVAFDGAADARGIVAVEEAARAALSDRRGRPVDGGFSSMRERLTTAARAAWGPVASALTAPLMQQGEAIGVIVVGSRQSHRYSDENRLLLSSVVTQVALMLSFSEVFSLVEEGYLQTVTALCGSLEEADRYPHSHPGALARHAVAVGSRMGMNEKERRQLQYAALLHDVGKAAVPGAVLDKAGALSAEELAQVRRHTIAAERLIAGIAYLAPIAGVVRAGHERWDGGGYPDGLRGEEIPLAARIVLVCDAFEALTHDRPYRAALPVDKALAELRANAGTQFDPRVVEVFLALGGLAPSEDVPAAAADLAGRGADQSGGASAGVAAS
ncbi:MAG: HD domain-containing phosphohydrolase [Actinomycetes bacterium]